ncbi:MAG: hypothetical protein ACLPY3_11745 [Solirubrobacteraceae bacterium]
MRVVLTVSSSIAAGTGGDRTGPVLATHLISLVWRRPRARLFENAEVDREGDERELCDQIGAQTRSGRGSR